MEKKRKNGLKARKLLALVLALMLVLALFAGCANNSQPAGTGATSEPATASPASPDSPASTSPEKPSQALSEIAGKPIKIGHICDLTGVQAMTGEEAKRALEFAVEALGGQFAGRPVEIIVGDAQNSSSVAVDLARKMVERDGVAAIFGPTQNGHKSAVAEYMKQAKVPLIFYNATPANIITNNDWIVGAGGLTPQIPTVMADYVYNDLGYRTLHLVAMDNVGYRAVTDPFVQAFEKLGGKVISQQFAPIPCADWAPFLVSLGKADAIAAWASGSDAIALWTAWYELGLSKKMPMFAVHHGGFTDYFIPNALARTAPEAVEAMLGALAPMLYVHDIKSPENEAFVKAWTAKFGSVPANNLPGSCYQAALLFKTAVESLNGDTTPDKLIKAIFEVDVTGPEGRLFFDNSHAATKDVYITKVIRMDNGTYNNAMVKVYKDVPPTGLANKE